MATNQPHSKRDVGGQETKGDKAKTGTGAPPKQDPKGKTPAKPATSKSKKS